MPLSLSLDAKGAACPGMRGIGFNHWEACPNQPIVTNNGKRIFEGFSAECHYTAHGGGERYLFSDCPSHGGSVSAGGGGAARELCPLANHPHLVETVGCIQRGTAPALSPHMEEVGTALEEQVAHS